MNNETIQISNLEELFSFTSKNPDNQLIKYEYYKGKYQLKKFFLSWKWPAFFFGPLWLLYRKMYALGILVIFIQLLFNAFMFFSIYAYCVISTTPNHLFLNTTISSLVTYTYTHIKILQNLTNYLPMCIIALIGNWCYGNKLESYINNTIPVKTKFTSKISIFIGLFVSLSLLILIYIVFRTSLLKLVAT